MVLITSHRVGAPRGNASFPKLAKALLAHIGKRWHVSMNTAKRYQGARVEMVLRCSSIPEVRPDNVSAKDEAKGEREKRLPEDEHKPSEEQ